MNREDRLPKWAQAELERLRRDLDSANQKLEAIGAGIGELYDLRRYSYDRTERPLAADRVGARLLLGTRCDVEVSVVSTRRLATRALHVYSPAGGLIVRPGSSNVVTIEVDPR